MAESPLLPSDIWPPVGNDRLSESSEIPLILDKTPTQNQTFPDTVLSDPAPSQEAEEPPSSVQPLEESHVSEQPPELVTRAPFVRTSSYNLRSGPK